MKKILGLMLVLMLCVSLVTLAAYADNPTIPASMSGPGTVRAGQTITVSYQLNGTNILAVDGTLNYDANKLTLTETKVLDGWEATTNGNKYVIDDKNLTSPINGQATLISFTFQVGNLAEGTPIDVSFTGVTAASVNLSTGETGQFSADASYTATVARPLGTNANLASLNISNATLSPAFDPSLTRYNVEVPFAITHLQLSAQPADPNATVSVYNPELEADKTNTITVTVTAENGATKEYMILAKRGKDPNYEPSKNNYLSNIVVEEFRLSPVFDKEVENYLIWLPYEVDSVKITGIAEDNYASIVVEGGSDLVAGADNPVKITCTAESGDERVYTIIVKRAPSHQEMSKPTVPTVPSTSPDSTGPISSNTHSSNTQYTRPTNGSQGSDVNAQRNKLLIVLYCVLGVLSIAGIAVCVLFVIATRKEGKFASKPSKDPSSQAQDEEPMDDDDDDDEIE